MFRDLLSAGISVIVISGFAIALIAWCAMLWSLIRIPFNLKPGVKAWEGGNPFNHIFKSENLASAGLAARKRFGESLIVFVITILAFATLGLVGKWLVP